MLFEQWFKLRKINFIGLPIIIENPKGSYREGVDPDGTPWKTYMHHAYGYVHGTTGADDEGIDCYLGPNENCTDIYIINQKNPKTNEFDEHKVMIGFNSPKHAYKSYIKQYDDPKFYQSMKVVPVDKFKQMINNNQLKTKHQNIKKEYVIYCNNKQINEDINIPINMGDIVLTGKFKNKKFIVKSVGKDDLGQPVVKNDKGKEIKLLAVRIEKLMKKSTGVKKEENVLFNKNVMYKYLKSLAVKNKLDISTFKPSQVIAGYKVEKEHDKGNDVDVARNDLDVLKIVVAHLREKSDYYTQLKKVEESSKMKINEAVENLSIEDSLKIIKSYQRNPSEVLKLDYTLLTKLPDDLKIVSTSIEAMKSKIKSLNNLKKIGDAIFYESDLTELPDGLIVKKTLDIRKCKKLTKLPNNLQCENLDISGCTGINDIPENLKVKNHLWIKGSGLDKLSKTKIKQMIEEKNGIIPRIIVCSLNENTKPMKLKEYIQQEVKNCIKENDTEYQTFFKSALDKFGVKSQDELSDEKKKEFFNYVDNNYKAKNESVKPRSKKMITEQLNFKSDVMYKFAELKSEFYKYETFLEFEVSDPVQQTEEYQQLKSQINNVKKCLVMLNNNLKKTFDVVNTVGQHEQKIKEQEKMQKR